MQEIYKYGTHLNYFPILQIIIHISHYLVGRNCEYETTVMQFISHNLLEFYFYVDKHNYNKKAALLKRLLRFSLVALGNTFVDNKLLPTYC